MTILIQPKCHGEEWPTAYLSDICLSITDGKHGDCRNQVGSGYYFLSAKDVRNGKLNYANIREITETDFIETHQRTNLEANDLLITNSGTIGRIAIATDDEKTKRTTFQKSVAILKPNTEILNPRFFYYSIIHNKRTLILLAGGTTQENLLLGDLRDFGIELPNLKTQKAIADVLLSLDDKIELLRKQNETLEAIAQTLFKEWFVHFNFPDKNGKPYKDNGGKMVDSELGEIPAGWRVRPFGDLLDYTIGGDWGAENADEQHTERVHIIRGTDIPTLRSCGKDKIPCRYVKPKKLLSRSIRVGDIIIEVSGGSTNQPTGRSQYFTRSIIERLGGVVEPASFCRLFRPKTLPIGVFAAIHLQILYDDGKTWNYQNQSTNISNFQTKEFLEREQIALPDDNEATDAFYDIVHPMIEKTNSNSIVTLGILRNTLLPKLMSGQVRVKGWESNA